MSPFKVAALPLRTKAPAPLLKVRPLNCVPPAKSFVVLPPAELANCNGSLATTLTPSQLAAVVQLASEPPPDQVAAASTVSPIAAEVLAAKSPLPLYTAATECVPMPSAAVYTAVPPLTAAGEPTALPSISNCTVPHGSLPLAGVTVAVNVTDWPETEATALSATLVRVAAWATVSVPHTQWML